VTRKGARLEFLAGTKRKKGPGSIFRSIENPAEFATKFELRPFFKKFEPGPFF
jgi:hypothetical protein